MNDQKDPKSKNDIIAIAVLIDFSGILILFFCDYFPLYWKVAGTMFLIFCLVVAMLGKQRKIGFANAFFLSFLLSPLIGLIITLSSAKIMDEVYKEKMLEMAAKNNGSTDIADQLYKLNELRKDGILTDEEFAFQKEKILNT